MVAAGVPCSVTTVRAAMACHLPISAGSAATGGVAWLGAATATGARMHTVAMMEAARARLRRGVMEGFERMPGRDVRSAAYAMSSLVGMFIPPLGQAPLSNR